MTAGMAENNAKYVIEQSRRRHIPAPPDGSLPLLDVSAQHPVFSRQLRIELTGSSTKTLRLSLRS